MNSKTLRITWIFLSVIAFIATFFSLWSVFEKVAVNNRVIAVLLFLIISCAITILVCFATGLLKLNIIGIRVIRGEDNIVELNRKIVANAKEELFSIGSRTRSGKYLKQIELVLNEKPTLRHYRVLWGLPHRKVLKEHLFSLLKISSPSDRPRRIYIGLFDDFYKEAERAICANEKECLIILPSLKDIGNFDTALYITKMKVVEKIAHYCKNLYHNSIYIETSNQIEEMICLREKYNKIYLSKLKIDSDE